MRIYLISIILLLSSLRSFSQDAESLLTEEESKDFTSATFKTTRLINFHTLETVGPKTLDFRISHRFGAINSGSYNAWGIDGPANIRLGLEYSFDGRFMVGIGRTSSEKMLDGFLKYRLLRQTTDGKMPVSVTLFAGMYRTALKNQIINGKDLYEYQSSRLSYCYQIMIGRKFNRNFSLQIAPWLVHYNIVEKITDSNDAYGISAIARMKFTQRAALTVEYGYRINEYTNITYYNSLGIGLEIETGGHVFQMHLTNSFGLVENQFLPRTNTQWNDAGIRLGFNVSRVFTLP